MTYALVAILGACCVWITQQLVKPRTRMTERYITLYNSGAEDWQRIGVRVIHAADDTPSVMIADIPHDSVATWISL